MRLTTLLKRPNIIPTSTAEHTNSKTPPVKGVELIAHNRVKVTTTRGAQAIYSGTAERRLRRIRRATTTTEARARAPTVV